VAAVAFEIELAFESVEDRLDGLAERFEELSAGPFGSPLRARRSSSMPAPARVASKSRPK